jgi:hypothetical protein
MEFEPLKENWFEILNPLLKLLQEIEPFSKIGFKT